jgi:hypothetical protein
MNTYNETEHEAVNPKKVALMNGVIMAVINIFIFLITYYAMPDILGNYAFGIGLLLVSIGLAVYFTLDLRKKIGGYWSFREALSNIFILFIVQYLIYTLFVMAFGKFIEPAYIDKMREISLNATVEVAERFGGGNQEAIDQMIAEAEKSIEKSLNPTFMEFLQSAGISMIMYFVGALIFAAIFKRERPVFATVSDEE